jgi:hypothetical protein
VSRDKNEFGGGNPNSLYVPMSEHEQEALSRLVAAGDLRVHVLEWGVVNNPRVIFGDSRLSLQFRLSFDRPAVPIPVYFFDLELRTGSGLLLFKDRKSCEYGGKPVSIAAGVFFDMAWDIQIKSMDPRLVKALTGARGLTSRLQDRDTGDMTLTGNMSLNTRQKGRIHTLRAGEEWSKGDTDRRTATSVDKQDKTRR